MLAYSALILLRAEQEQAVRRMFEAYNWTCCINILSEETVGTLCESGFARIFPKMLDEQHQAVDRQVKAELTSPLKQVSSKPDSLCTQNFVETENNILAPTDSLTQSICDKSSQESNFSIPQNSVNAEFMPENRDPGIRNESELEISDGIAATNNNKIGFQNSLSYDNRDSYTSGSEQSVVSDTMAINFVSTDVVAGGNSSSSPTDVAGAMKPVPVPVAVSQTLLKKGITAVNQMDYQVQSAVKKLPVPLGVEGEPYIADVNGEPKLYFLQGPFPVVGIGIPNPQAWKPGRKKRRPPKFPYKCTRCPQMYASYEELHEHIQKEEKELAVKKQNRQQYEQEMKKKGCLQCAECGKYFTTKRKLQQHHYGSHRELLPDFQCGACSKTFFSRNDLWKHKKITNHTDCHSSKDSFLCERCGKVLQRYTSFWEHNKRRCGEIEEMEPTIPCTQCDALFKHNAALKSHLKRVHSYSPEICDVCGKEYRNKIKLQGHMSTHRDSGKRFECTKCERVFTKRVVLEQHMRTHTKEKPFKCPQCDYVCAVKGNVNKHSVKVHKVLLKAVDLRQIDQANANEWPSCTVGLSVSHGSQTVLGNSSYVNNHQPVPESSFPLNSQPVSDKTQFQHVTETILGTPSIPHDQGMPSRPPFPTNDQTQGFQYAVHLGTD